MKNKGEFKSVDIIKYVIEEIRKGNLVFFEVKKTQGVTPSNKVCGPMLAAQIGEDITFEPPMWDGNKMDLSSGGYVMMDPYNPTNIYGVTEVQLLMNYTNAPGEFYNNYNISDKWTRRELEDLFAGVDRKTEISLDTYLRVSAYLGYNDYQDKLGLK